MAEEFAGQTPPAAVDPMGNGALSPGGAAAAAGDDDPMEVGSAKSGDDGGLSSNSPTGGAEDANGFVENGDAYDAMMYEAGGGAQGVEEGKEEEESDSDVELEG